MTKKTVLFVLFIVLSLTGCQQNKTSSTQKNERLPESSQATYISDKYGFSFQYPGDWEVYDNSNSNFSGIVVTPENEKEIKKNNGTPIFNIIGVSPKKVASGEIKNERRKLADTWIERTRKNNSDVNVLINETEIKIEDVVIVRAETKNVKMQSAETDLNSKNYVLGNGSMYYFIYKGQRFMMSYVYPVNKESQYKNVFEKLISSIDFQ